MTSRYSYSNLGGEEILCRADADSLISTVKKLIFDCDGVIVSDRDSYRQAIARSVDYYFLRIVGLKGEERCLVTQEDIQKIKDTGAFNNDWNLTYALITYYLGLMIRRLQGEVQLRRIAELKGEPLKDILERLKDLGARAGQLGIDTTYLERMKTDRLVGFNSLVEEFSEKANIPILKPVGRTLKLGRAELEAIETFCPFDTEGDDLLRRLFDEIYLGSTLYERFSGKKSFFRFAEGLIDREEKIPTMQTLDRLKASFGPFALYSERPRKEGFYILQRHNLLSYFDRKATFFNEDIKGTHFTERSGSGWGKPDARAFVHLFKKVCGEQMSLAYIGDTVADALMVKNARKLEARSLIFIGTLSSSTEEEGLKSKFMELGAEVIVKDTNSLPTVFDIVGT